MRYLTFLLLPLFSITLFAVEFPPPLTNPHQPSKQDRSVYLELRKQIAALGIPEVSDKPMVYLQSGAYSPFLYKKEGYMDYNFHWSVMANGWLLSESSDEVKGTKRARIMLSNGTIVSVQALPEGMDRTSKAAANYALWDRVDPARLIKEVVWLTHRDLNRESYFLKENLILFSLLAADHGYSEQGLQLFSLLQKVASHQNDLPIAETLIKARFKQTLQALFEQLNQTHDFIKLRDQLEELQRISPVDAGYHAPLQQLIQRLTLQIDGKQSVPTAVHALPPYLQKMAERMIFEDFSNTSVMDLSLFIERENSSESHAPAVKLPPFMDLFRLLTALCEDNQTLTSHYLNTRPKITTDNGGLLLPFRLLTRAEVSRQLLAEFFNLTDISATKLNDLQLVTSNNSLINNELFTAALTQSVPDYSSAEFSYKRSLLKAAKTQQLPELEKFYLSEASKDKASTALNLLQPIFQAKSEDQHTAGFSDERILNQSVYEEQPFARNNAPSLSKTVRFITTYALIRGHQNNKKLCQQLADLAKQTPSDPAKTPLLTGCASTEPKYTDFLEKISQNPLPFDKIAADYDIFNQFIDMHLLTSLYPTTFFQHFLENLYQTENPKFRHEYFDCLSMLSRQTFTEKPDFSETLRLPPIKALCLALLDEKHPKHIKDQKLLYEFAFHLESLLLSQADQAVLNAKGQAFSHDYPIYRSTFFTNRLVERATLLLNEAPINALPPFVKTNSPKAPGTPPQLPTSPHLTDKLHQLRQMAYADQKALFSQIEKDPALLKSIIQLRHQVVNVHLDKALAKPYKKLKAWKGRPISSRLIDELSATITAAAINREGIEIVLIQPPGIAGCELYIDRYTPEHNYQISGWGAGLIGQNSMAIVHRVHPTPNKRYGNEYGYSTEQEKKAFEESVKQFLTNQALDFVGVINFSTKGERSIED